MWGGVQQSTSGVWEESGGGGGDLGVGRHKVCVNEMYMYIQTTPLRALVCTSKQYNITSSARTHLKVLLLHAG